MPTGSPPPEGDGATTEHGPDEPRPGVDVTGALHEAGHEEALLGTEGVPDTGPVLRQPDDEDRRDLGLDAAAELGLHGDDGVV